MHDLHQLDIKLKKESLHAENPYYLYKHNVLFDTWKFTLNNLSFLPLPLTCCISNMMNRTCDNALLNPSSKTSANSNNERSQ